jgi:hypothetical protein
MKRPHCPNCNRFRTTFPAVLLAIALLVLPRHASAAVKAFFIFQSPATETVGGGIATNFIVTLTYSNASGTINNAVFADGASVVPSGQGVTVSLASSSPPVADNGGTATMPMTISATANAPASATYQIIVSATNSAYTANVPPGIASLTNLFIIGPPANSNGFSVALSPGAASCLAGAATNFTSTVTVLDASKTISGTVTNGVTVSPSGQGVTANLNSIYAPITNNFGQTNLTLTVNVSPGATPGAYSITVSGTNSAFTANPGPGVASATYNLNLTTLKEFTLGLAPSAESVTGGATAGVTVTVVLTNLSTILSEPITSGVTVNGPYPGNVTASLSSTSASPATGGGTAAFTLSITNNGSSLPGAYQVIVGSTNTDFTDNSPIPGVALATNLFTVNAPPLSIQHFSLSGMNLTLTGFGGGPSGQYIVCSSTSLTLPLAQWTPVATNTFDINGNFNALIPLASTLNPSAAQQFFTLVLPSTGTNPVATPVFSPAAGPFFAQTPVTITTATSGALIRYTTDGTTPTESNGSLYTGPVTMLQPVDTNQSGFVTNASGVTMLKAIAYKGGMPDSAVWTGIYEILDSVDFPPAAVPSPLVGVAHLAYNVSSANWSNILSLWTNYFGFAPLLISNNYTLIKINDRQFVELNQVPVLVSNQWQQVNLGFEVNNAEAYRELLASNGVSVPPSVTTNALGNLSFLTVDPDGHTNEWVQYLSNSVTGLSQGQYMPGTILAGFANDLGVWTTDETLDGPHNYYVNQCGFLGTGNEVFFPSGGKRYIELLTTGPSGPTQAISGKHGKIQFLNFRGMDLFQTLNILTNRDPSIPITLSVEGTSNSILHNAADVYDSDLSRIRINDE